MTLMSKAIGHITINFWVVASISDRRPRQPSPLAIKCACARSYLDGEAARRMFRYRPATRHGTQQMLAESAF